MYKYEPHLHTNAASACASNSGAEMARASKDAGYTGIFITDHFWGGNTSIDYALPWRQWVDAYTRGYFDAKETGEKIGLDVFFGWESCFDGTEFLIYGLTPEWLYEHPEVRFITPEEQYSLVHEGGGFVVHAHPFRHNFDIPCIRLFPQYEDAVEAINATHSHPNVYPVKHRTPEWDEEARAYAAENGLPMTAGSDIHTTRLFGGGILTKNKLQSCDDYFALLKGSEDYFLTDGKNIYDRYGRKTGESL